MRKANIRVTMQPRDYDFRNAVDVCMDIDELVGIVENESVDFNCRVAPGKGFMPVYEVQTCSEGLLKHREGTAKYIADVLTEKIMEILSQDDTIQGYSKEEWKKMYNREG